MGSMAAFACYNPAKANKLLLSKYEKSPPSLAVHIYPSHWTLNDSKPLSYSGALSSLLKSIHDRILPIDLLPTLEEKKIPFYEGCMIVDVIKHANDPSAQPKNPDEKPTKKDILRERRVLWPNSESLFLDIANINAKNGNNMTDMDSLMVESSILLATAPPLCLTPDPIVSRIANAALIAGQPEGTGKTLSLGTKRKRFGDSTEDAAIREKRAKLLSVMDPRAGKPAVPRGVSKFEMMLKARDKLAADAAAAAAAAQQQQQQQQQAAAAAAPHPVLTVPQAPPPAAAPAPPQMPAAVAAPIAAAAPPAPSVVDKDAPKKKPPPKPKKAPSAKPEPQQGLLGLALPVQARQPGQPGGPPQPPPINTNVRAPSVATTVSAGPSATPASAGPKKKAATRPAPARPTVPISQIAAAAAAAAAAGGPSNRPASSVAPSPSPASSNIPLASLAQSAGSSQPAKKKAKLNGPASRAPSHPGGPSSVPSTQTSPQSGPAGGSVPPMPDGAAHMPPPPIGFPANFANLNPQHQHQYYVQALANATNASHMGNAVHAANMQNMMAGMPQPAPGQPMPNPQAGGMPLPAGAQNPYGNILPPQPGQPRPAGPAGGLQTQISDDMLNRAVLMYTQAFHGQNQANFSDQERANLHTLLQAAQGDPRLQRAIALARQNLAVRQGVPVPPGQPGAQQPHLPVQQPQPQQATPAPGQPRMPTPAMQNQRGPTPAMPPPHATPAMGAQRMPTPLQGQQRIATPGSQSAPTPAMMPASAQLNPRATPNPQQQRLQQAQQQGRLAIPGGVPISGQQGRVTPNPQAAAAGRMAQWSPQQIQQYQMQLQQHQQQQQQQAAHSQQQFLQQQQQAAQQQAAQQQQQRSSVPGLGPGMQLQQVAQAINANPNLLPQFLMRVSPPHKAAFIQMLLPHVQQQAQFFLAQAISQAQQQQHAPQQQPQQQQQFNPQFPQGQQWPPAGYPMNGMWPQQGQQ